MPSHQLILSDVTSDEFKLRTVHVPPCRVCMTFIAHKFVVARMCLLVCTFEMGLENTHSRLVHSNWKIPGIRKSATTLKYAWNSVPRACMHACSLWIFGGMHAYHFSQFPTLQWLPALFLSINSCTSSFSKKKNSSNLSHVVCAYFESSYLYFNLFTEKISCLTGLK